MDKIAALKIISVLENQHPNAKCELDYNTPFELLVAVILSAQCTDKCVNKVTTELFKKYNTAEQFAKLDQKTLEKEIYSTGFYSNKAKNIIMASKTICDDFGGKVPNNPEYLRSLAGVGRKTANVVYAEAFGGNAIAVDTHVFRVANRIGLATAENPEKTEFQLMNLLPEKLWSRAHHLLVFHGRYICKSKKPDCNACLVKKLCQNYLKNEVN